MNRRGFLKLLGALAVGACGALLPKATKKPIKAINYEEVGKEVVEKYIDGVIPREDFTISSEPSWPDNLYMSTQGGMCWDPIELPVLETARDDIIAVAVWNERNDSYELYVQDGDKWVIASSCTDIA